MQFRKLIKDLQAQLFGGDETANIAPVDTTETNAKDGTQTTTRTPHVQPVIDVTQMALLDLKPVALVVSLKAANTAQRLNAGRQFVQRVIIIGGPQLDGVTPNAGNVFIGGAAVSIETGVPLAPGGSFDGIGPCDLADLYIIGANVGDTLRVLIFA